ncbi:MAG: Ig-like domain-containing protein [Gemmatimonadaceae bacterium]
MNRMRIRALASPIAALCMVALLAAGCGELTGPTSPSTPTGVTATLLSATSVRVSWTPSPQNDGVVSYSVFRNGAKVGESTTTTFTDNGLSPQQTYKYTVAANCTSGLISDQSADTPASTVTTLDVTPPTVIPGSIQPPAGNTSVSPAATASVTFSEPMDPTTINTTTFNLKVTSTGALIPGTVTYTPATRIAEFKPTSPLPNPINFTATVTTGVKDLAGNAMAAPFAWGFRTRDESPPTVLSTTPANGGTAAPSAILFISFSEAMDPTTINTTNITLQVTSSGAAVAGTVAYNTTTRNASFTPSQTLAQATGYTLTISGAVKDSVGNQMGTAVIVNFTTLDVTAPTVVSTVPADGAIGVSPTAPISAKFSEPMDISSINATTFTLQTTSGQSPVSGTITFDNASSTATFTPSSSLASATSYTATITTGARDVSGNALAANKVWSFTTADIVKPTVLSVSPANNSSGVATTTTVQVTFSEPMASSSITTTTVTLTNTLTNALIPASVSYNTATNVATLTPTASLAGGTNYTVTVTTGATDVAGNALASAFTSAFTTVVVDTTPPTIILRNPANGAAGVATNVAPTVTFNEPMDATTINTTNIRLAETATSNSVAGTVSYNAATNTATFTPSAPLSNNISYTLTVTTGVKDVAGNALAANSTATFTTVPDTTAPTIIATSPINNATGVPVGTVVKVTFSEAMDATTINATNFKLNVTAGGAVVTGTVTYDAATRVATFTPSASLALSTKYTATVTTGVKDAAGNPLATNATFDFTTAP